MPFCFSDGESCANFNQLALACDERWVEAQKLLAEGVWQSFFSALGRLDLATAAKQAVKEPDPDVGLSQFLEKFPTDPDVLRPPQPAVSPAEQDLGVLTPGKDHTFELRITNQGKLVLRGMVSTDCEWLSFGEPVRGPALRMFQTRAFYTLPVRVLGNKLRAGRKPLEGTVVVDTNGGAITLPVRARVPVRPFPKGAYANDVLAGATSPQELAIKAKANPDQAAVLFEQGAVRAWYASNGWSYPIQGTEGTGKGAVQQFFEALGLTKPPRLGISAETILCTGLAGQRFTKHVTVSTQEARPVYAYAWSNQDWIKPGTGKSQGNKVTIPLQIDVPARPGETLHAQVTFQGNGQQQFVVPVTVTVAAAAAARPSVKVEAEESSRRLPLGWIFAGVGLLLLVAVGVVAALVATSPGDDVDPPIVHIPPPPVSPLTKDEAWWDSIPDTQLPATVAALKECVPQEKAMFEKIALKSDVDRYPAYEKLEASLPEILRNPKAWDPLARMIVACYVFEPSELNVSPLRRALTRQVPREGAEFRPEDKGTELERGIWSLQVAFSTLTHKAIRLDRARSLANDLGTVFGFALDTNAPPGELKAHTEELLAQRCYRNTLPTAARSLDHALAMRALLIEKFPQHLLPAFRDKIDVDLIAVGLSKENDAFDRFEPILKTCLESNDLTTLLKIVDVYEQAKPDRAQKLDGLLAAKWKATANPKLTQAAKVVAIRKILAGAADSAKITPEERRAQLRKLSESALSAVKPAQRKDLPLLQDTLRLAHASTMACFLFQKESALERFDELVARVPLIEQAVEPGPNPEKPAPANEGIPVADQPKIIQGRLTLSSQRDSARRGPFCDVHRFTLKAGQVYTIEMKSGTFKVYLRLEDPRGNQVADDRSGRFAARIVFTAPADGTYRVIATSLATRQTGAYTLIIRHGLGFGFGLGPPFPRRPFGPFDPFGPPIPVPGVMPAPNGEKKETSLSLSDLADLESTQRPVRLAALANLAGNFPNDVAPRHAQRLAKYLLSIQDRAELEEVTAKLESFAKCRHFLLALADQVGKDETRPKTAEAIVGGVLGKAAQFARDEDWRTPCRKMLLQRALDLSQHGPTAADQAAEVLRALYREQGVAFGMDDADFAMLHRPAQALEALVKHVAARAANQELPPEHKDYLAELGRHLRAAQFVANNDLEQLVVLQRIWLKVLTIYVHQAAPAQAQAMAAIQGDLVNHDRSSASALDQLRAGEESVLRIWMMVHNLK
jgi:hypothetical protein